MSTRSIIVSEIETIAREQGKQIVPLNDELPLLETSLDSLCFAILVSRLEDILGVDPFSAASPAEFPRTLGDFVAFYDRARV